MLSAGVIIELVHMDASGSVAAVTYHVPTGTTYIEADASAIALASALVSLTGCVLVRQRIKYYVVRDNPSPAAIDSTLKRRGVFFMTTSGAGMDAVIEIPSPIDSIFEPSGVCAGYCIDLANTDVMAVVSELIAAGACNPFGDAVTAVDAAYLQSRV